MIVRALIRRNMKLFFKDKGMFFTAMITPVILLVLYVTFLGDVYRDSFVMAFPEGLAVPDQLLNGLVGGQLVSSILAVSSVTVTFCANFLMVQDKVNGAGKDLRIAPVKASELSLGYYLATLFSTLLICYIAAAFCFVYLAIVGWYLSVADLFLILLDVFLLVLFGTALSSVINFFLTSQGQISAIGSIVSSGYGFVSGAYMPISSFGKPLQILISFLPGTYGTSLLRSHAMQGALDQLATVGMPADGLRSLTDMLDCNLYFFGFQVATPIMYAVLVSSVCALMGVYILLNRSAARSRTA